MCYTFVVVSDLIEICRAKVQNVSTLITANKWNGVTWTGNFNRMTDKYFEGRSVDTFVFIVISCI